MNYIPLLVLGMVMTSTSAMADDIDESFCPDPNLEETRVRHHRDGNIQECGRYIERTPVGEHYVFYSSGQVNRYRMYDDSGTMTEERLYAESGQISRQISTIDTDYGAGRETIRYHDNGEVASHQKQTSDRQWRWQASYDESGEVLERGEFYQGMRRGPWILPAYQARMMVTYNDNGNMHGRFEERSDDGSELTVQYYNDGVPHGRLERWIDDKQVELGEYENGAREGDWFVIHPQTKVETRGRYVGGVAVGEWDQRDPNGFLVGRNTYDSAGMRHGMQLSFTANGALEYANNYQHGVLHGEYIEYFNGMPHYKSYYEEGQWVDGYEIE